MEIRIRESGQVMYESEFRSLFRNTSLPRLTKEVLDSLGADVVFEGAQAQPTRYQTAFRDGVEQIGDKWFTKYSIATFKDTTDEDGNVITAEQQEAEHIARVDAEQAKSVRDSRNKLLSDCDWTQVVDSPVNKEAWATYRQALRDLPDQAGFPFDVVYPDAP
jgi:hypothetical protein